jgi:chemotaxis protein MotB
MLLVVSVLALAGCGSGELERENADLRQQLDALRSENDATNARLSEMEAQNRELLERLNVTGENFQSLEEARNALAAELERARAREEAQRARLASFRRVIDQFRQLMASGQLRVRITRGKMVVELPEGVLFDSGRAELKDAGEETLRQVAGVLAQIENRELLIGGHTDNVPIRSRRFPSNWELSAARGVVVARFLADNGVPATRIAAAGYADTQPVATNDTDEGRAQNRRIEIILMPNLDELPDLSSLESELEGASGGGDAPAGD